MLKNIRGAIFDMDGTLINSLIFWEMLWRRFGELFLDGAPFAPTPEEDKAVRTMTMHDAMCYIHSLYSMGESGEELFRIASDMIERFYAEEVQLKPGVRTFLEFLRKAGVRMCIASATERRLIEVAAEHCGIRHYFEEIFSCAEIGKGKDEPDLYLSALSFLGTEREATCVFEDSHVAICTAAGLGMPTVGIFDPCNYGGEEMAKIATEYIAEGETLEKLLEQGIF